MREDPIRLRLGFASVKFGCTNNLVLPRADRTLFNRNPEIKAEAIWVGEYLKQSNVLATLTGRHVGGLAAAGKRTLLASNLAPFDITLTHAASPKEAPEINDLCDGSRPRRFYDQL